MEEIEEIERMIRMILSRHNLSTPEGRDAAYSECIEYAENDLAHDLRCNAFLRRVAEMLEKEPVEYDVVREMVEMPDEAALDISYEERHGFIITGNVSGILYLADLLRVLAEAPPGEHVHLYNDEEPLTTASFNAVFFVEEDEFFSRIAEDSQGRGEQGEGPARRNITPKEIFALQIVGDIPADLTLTRDRIYKVEGYSNPLEEGVCKKAFSGDEDRYVTFKITDDNGESLEVILHLEDPDVNYFKKSDFAGLIE